MPLFTFAFDELFALNFDQLRHITNQWSLRTKFNSVWQRRADNVDVDCFTWYLYRARHNQSFCFATDIREASDQLVTFFPISYMQLVICYTEYVIAQVTACC